jgi:hypothetical protein
MGVAAREVGVLVDVCFGFKSRQEDHEPWVDLGVADPFLKMVNLQTVAGFELLRGNYL